MNERGEDGSADKLSAKCEHAFDGCWGRSKLGLPSACNDVRYRSGYSSCNGQKERALVIE